MELGPGGEEEEKWHLNYRSEGRRKRRRKRGRKIERWGQGRKSGKERI